MAAEVRPIPLSKILAARGFEGRREGVSTMWSGNGLKINVTGDSLFFDHKAGKGGIGAIDLIKYLDNVGFREAVETLSGGKHNRLVALQAVVQPLPQRRPLDELMKEYATRDDQRWPRAAYYLTRQRCLPPSSIYWLYKSGRVYANDRGGVVFLHHDAHGQVGGATIKSANFSQCIGNKTGAWFYAGRPIDEAQRIAITESPIDAISYSVLHPDKHLCVVSIAGQYIPEQLLATAEGRPVIIAIDNPEFEKSTEASEITQGIVESTLAKCPNARLHTPMAKDWNDDLCAARKRHVKAF